MTNKELLTDDQKFYRGLSFSVIAIVAFVFALCGIAVTLKSEKQAHHGYWDIVRIAWSDIGWFFLIMIVVGLLTAVMVVLWRKWVLGLPWGK